jgi:hypothetical protein
MLDEEYTVKFGSRTIIFCPLTVKHIRTMPDEITALTTVTKSENPFSPERFAKLLKLYTASAQRTDPNVTESDVENIVDFRNIYKINKALLGQDWRSEPKAGNGADKESVQTPTSPPTGGEFTTAS